MTSYQQALDIILGEISPLPPITLPAGECDGLTLAEDVAPNLPAGTVLNSSRLLAGLGADGVVSAYPQPRVYLLADTPLESGLRAMIERAGCRLNIPTANVHNTPSQDKLRAKLAEQVAQCLIDSDVMVFASAEHAPPLTRKGEHDRILLAEVSITPGGDSLKLCFAGKPRPAGGQRLLLLLPPEPAAVAVGWTMIGAVVVNRLLGRPADRCRPRRVLALNEGPQLPAAGERLLLVPAVLRADEKFTGWRVQPIGTFGGNSEENQTLLAEANALMVRPAGGGSLPAGAVCEVIPLERFV